MTQEQHGASFVKKGPPPMPLPQNASSIRCRSCRRAIDSDDPFCRYCGNRQSPAGGWLYRPVTLIILGFLVLGPLAIPLVLLSPYLGRKGKTILTVAIILSTILTLYLVGTIASRALQQWDDLSRELDLMN